MFGLSSRVQEALYQAEWSVRVALVGAIGGVHFDLRHRELTPENWAVPPLVTAVAPLHPGFHLAEDETSTASGGALFDGLNWGELARRSRVEAEQAGKIVLYPGDRVAVAGFESIRAQDPLALVPDRERAVVRLKVHRPGGEVADGGTFLIKRRGHVEDPASVDFRVLRDRLRFVPESDRADALRKLADAIDVTAQRLRLHLDGSHTAQPKVSAGLLEGLLGDGIQIHILVDQAVAYGYLQATLEHAPIKPLARKTVERRDQNRLAGGKNADPERKQFAQAYFSEFPTATAYAAARKYCDTHPDDDFKSVERTMRRNAPPSSPSYRPPAEKLPD